MAADFVVTAELTALAEQAKRQGLGNGVDFYIRGLPFTGPLGSDLIGLSFDGNEYTVEQRGSDRTRDLLRTRDFTAARQLFLTEAERLAAGCQPRRPHRPDPVVAPPKPHSRLSTVLLATGLGFLFGLLVIPAMVLLVAFATASGSYGSASDKPNRPWRGDWDQKLGLALGTVVGLVVLAAVLFAVLAR